MVSGPLFDRYGEKTIYIPSLGYILAIMMTSLCKEYYQFILAQGILGGMCVGLIFTPAIAVPNHYFRARIATAAGFIVASSSLGGILFPIIINNLLQSSLGFGWTVRLCGFIVLAFLAIACATIKSRRLNNGDEKGAQQTKPKPGPLLRRPIYLASVFGTFFLTWGMFTPYFFLTSFAVKAGMGVSLASYLISILNAASFFGRVFTGLAADKVGRYNMLFLSAVSSAVLLFCWDKTDTANAAIIVFTVLYGFCSGAIISLMNACIAQITPDHRMIGISLGVLMFVNSFSGLSGPPISGALVTRFGSFQSAGYFGGFSTLIGAGFILAVRLQGAKGWRSAF